ncbi:MAG: MarR family winged helix-turn-helix transcriptional regulator, partial [Gemmatimonadaceae bacterium]
AASLGELAERTHTHQSSASVVVRRLVERGLVRRDADPADRRRRHLTLTAAGRRLVRDAPITTQARLVDSFRALPAATRRPLAAGLQRWVDAAGLGRTRAAFFFEDDGPATASDDA